MNTRLIKHISRLAIVAGCTCTALAQGEDAKKPNRPDTQVVSVSTTGNEAKTTANAKKPAPAMKHFLMTGIPNNKAWENIVKSGGDMADPARKSIEAMGGKLISYWVGVGEAKNYGIVAFPDSKNIAKIVYMRTIQGVMTDISFVEIMPTSEAAELFKELTKGDKNLKMSD